MGIIDKVKDAANKTKDAVTPKFLKKDAVAPSAQEIRMANLSAYDKEMANCPLFIDESALIANQLLSIGIHTKLPRKVLIIRGLKSDHSATKEGTELLAYNFRKFLSKYEPNFIIRIDLGGFRNLSITTLSKNKTILTKIASTDNEGIVTLAENAQFITINKGEN